MKELQTELVVIGAGPGGYAAAFYARDLGKQVTLVDARKYLGGVCLNEGCIPSKALLHATQMIEQASVSSDRGIVFAKPSIDLEKLRAWKKSILDRLAAGVSSLGDQRGVERVRGRARFEDPRVLCVDGEEGPCRIRFEAAIIATGSQAVLPGLFASVGGPVMTSKEALALTEVPGSLLVIGGGYIGMEVGTIYAALGCAVHLVEALDTVLAGVDSDLIRPVMRYAESHFKSIRLNAKVEALENHKGRIRVALEQAGKASEETYDRALVTVGRRPASEGLDLEKAGVDCGPDGFIQVDEKQRTWNPAIYAIGDVAGAPLLAHKAAKEARVAVDALTGHRADAVREAVIPAVLYTHPEVAWCGLTETRAKEKKIPYQVARFSWAASGKAVAMGQPDGLTKLIIAPETGRILGVGMAGVGVAELIAEGVVAVQQGLTARALADCVHPHPTLSETLMECAEAFYGHATHTLPRRRRVR